MDGIRHLADGTTTQLDERAAILDKEANFFTMEAKRVQLVSAEVKAPTRLDLLELGRITAGGGSTRGRVARLGGWKSSRGRYNTKAKRMTANTPEKQSPNGKRRLKSWKTVKKCWGGAV